MLLWENLSHFLPWAINRSSSPSFTAGWDAGSSCPCFSLLRNSRAQQGQNFNFFALGSKHQQISPAPQQHRETRAFSAQQLKSLSPLNSSAFSIISLHWANNRIFTCQSVFKLNWTDSPLPKPSLTSFYFTQKHHRALALLCSSKTPFKGSPCRWLNLNSRGLQAQPTVAEN